MEKKLKTLTKLEGKNNICFLYLSLSPLSFLIVERLRLDYVSTFCWLIIKRETHTRGQRKKVRERGRVRFVHIQKSVRWDQVTSFKDTLHLSPSLSFTLTHKHIHAYTHTHASTHTCTHTHVLTGHKSNEDLVL